jgi:hypothetical protein
MISLTVPSYLKFNTILGGSGQDENFIEENISK